MAYCDWGTTDELMRPYHDREWGEPVHDDRTQFEHLSMEVLQCGLNWRMMLVKRDVFRTCFANFDVDTVAAFGEEDVERILATPGMIRSRPKVEAIVNNARCFQRVQAEHGSFSAFLWAYTDNKTVLYNRHDEGWIPASNGLSARISRDLKALGFKYTGPVTVYSHLQACGIINDHDAGCPCFARINAAHPTVRRRRYLERDVQFFGE